MIREAIFKLVDKQDLTYDEAYDVINEIMSGETTQVQTAAFLSALSTKSTKSETIAEIAGCAAAMRSHATKALITISLCSRLWAQAGIKLEASTSLPPQRSLLQQVGQRLPSMETGQHRASRVRQIAKRLWA